MTHVPCEVVEADELEARQSFQRNRHGRMNPVRLGQMFAQMMRHRGRRRLRSNRDLSAERRAGHR
jgi:hypothetical protein